MQKEVEWSGDLRRVRTNVAFTASLNTYPNQHRVSATVESVSYTHLTLPTNREV